MSHCPSWTLQSTGQTEKPLYPGGWLAVQIFRKVGPSGAKRHITSRLAEPCVWCRGCSREGLRPPPVAEMAHALHDIPEQLARLRVGQDPLKSFKREYRKFFRKKFNVFSSIFSISCHLGGPWPRNSDPTRNFLPRTG